MADFDPSRTSEEWIDRDLCKTEAPPYLDSAGVALTTDDLVYVTEDLRRMYRGEYVWLDAGSLALIFAFPMPGKAMITATFYNRESQMRCSIRRIVPRTVLVRIVKRFMRKKWDDVERQYIYDPTVQ